MKVQAYDDSVPEDVSEAYVTLLVTRNENPPTFPPGLGPFIISKEVPPGYRIVTINATDADGVSLSHCVSTYDLSNRHHQHCFVCDDRIA